MKPLTLMRVVFRHSRRRMRHGSVRANAGRMNLTFSSCFCGYLQFFQRRKVQECQRIRRCGNYCYTFAYLLEVWNKCRFVIG